MYNIIALMGKAGAGKDALMKTCLAQHPRWHEIISYTTRPPREGEIDGVNYHFVTEEEFKEKIKNHEMLEHTCFNNWFYGTSEDSLDKNCLNIGVFNPSGIIKIQKEQERRATYTMEYTDAQINLQTFYITTSDKERLLRQLNREENPDVNEIIRRWQADEKDFQLLNFTFVNYTMLDNSGDLNDAAQRLQANLD